MHALVGNGFMSPNVHKQLVIIKKVSHRDNNRSTASSLQLWFYPYLYSWVCGEICECISQIPERAPKALFPPAFLSIVPTTWNQQLPHWCICSTTPNMASNDGEEKGYTHLETLLAWPWRCKQYWYLDPPMHIRTSITENWRESGERQTPRTLGP